MYHRWKRELLFLEPGKKISLEACHDVEQIPHHISSLGENDAGNVSCNRCPANVIISNLS